MKETEPMNNINLMVRETECRLRIELRKAKEDLYTAGQNLGDAFGPNCDWHDNSAADFAVEEYKRIGAREAELQAALRNVEIIEPRQEINDVGLGNTIIVRMGDSNEDEKFTLLGPYDGIIGQNKVWISYQSLVGQVLMGMKRGETKTFKLRKGQTQTITVKEILQGEFQ